MDAWIYYFEIDMACMKGLHNKQAFSTVLHMMAIYSRVDYIKVNSTICIYIALL